MPESNRFFFFKEIDFVNPENFNGHRSLILSKKRTIFAGGPESGNDKIFKALLNSCSQKNFKENEELRPEERAVRIKFEGDQELIKNFNSIVFFDGEINELSIFDKLFRLFNHELKESLDSEAKTIFNALLKNKPHKRKFHSDLEPSLMATGEKTCLKYAYVFAIRKVLHLSLPFVAKAPFASLDHELQSSLKEFFDDFREQQILLLGLHEKEKLCTDEKAFFL